MQIRSLIFYIFIWMHVCMRHIYKCSIKIKLDYNWCGTICGMFSSLSRRQCSYKVISMCFFLFERWKKREVKCVYVCVSYSYTFCTFTVEFLIYIFILSFIRFCFFDFMFFPFMFTLILVFLCIQFISFKTNKVIMCYVEEKSIDWKLCLLLFLLLRLNTLWW